jgi:hypothetical protein
MSPSNCAPEVNKKNVFVSGICVEIVLILRGHTPKVMHRCYTRMKKCPKKSEKTSLLKQ